MWFRKSALMAHWHMSVFAIDDTLEVLPLKEGGTGIAAIRLLRSQKRMVTGRRFAEFGSDD